MYKFRCIEIELNWQNAETDNIVRPDEIEHITNLDNIRKSQRTHRAPGYLQDFHCTIRKSLITWILNDLPDGKVPIG